MSPSELRAKLGMSEGQLLTNGQGESADILAIDGEFVLLGVLTRRDPIRVPISSIVRKLDLEPNTDRLVATKSL